MWQKFSALFTKRNLLNLVALFVIGYLSLVTIQVISRNYRLQQELDALEEEISVLELRNQELEYQIAYYKTDAFAEKEARDKLGLRAPGENVVIFPSKIPGTSAVPVVDQTAGGTVQEAINNFEQWLYFLFKKEPS